MKPTPTPELLKAAVEAVWKYSLVIESSVRRGDGPDQYAGVVEALQLVKDARAALSVPAAAVVGEPERDAMRRRIYADLAKEGGGTWATYVCMDIFALEDAAFIAGKEAAPSAPEGWQPIETAPKDGTIILAYFPLEGLSKDWCRVVTVFWGGQQRGWIFAGRAASGFSREYQPTHWRPLPAPPALGGASHE